MSQVEILIIAQVAFILVVAIGFLVLLLRRQKKAISRLQELLVSQQEDASGATLVKQLQIAIDDTTAHCAQETITLMPEASAEDQAISLRYAALSYELSLLQSSNGEISPWRAIIQPYNDLASIYVAHIQSIPEKERLKFKGQMAEMDKEQRRLEEEGKILKKELATLKPITDFFDQGFSEDASKNEIELSLHNALVALCDTVERAEGLREVVYLIHESYYEKGSGPSESTTIESTPAPAHAGTLSNIITEQNKLIHDLRTRLGQAEGLEGGSELIAHLDVLEQNFNAAQIQIENLETQLREARENQGSDTVPTADGEDFEYSQDEMFDLIEQFTEESADMVERLHLLQNQNKQYIKENDELREQVSGGGGDAEGGDDASEPLVSGLKMQLEEKGKEILQLQQSFKEVEEKYLALYEETMEEMISGDSESSADDTQEAAKDEPVTDPTDIDAILAGAKTDS